MLQPVGTFEINTKGDKKNYNLKINMPFFPELDCFGIDNPNKDSDTKADVRLFYKKNPVGSLWFNQKDDSKYWSGNIFAFGVGERHQLKLMIFWRKPKEGSDKPGYWQVCIPIDDGQRNETPENNIPDDMPM